MIMKFYEMLSKYEEDIIDDEVPASIEEKLNNLSASFFDDIDASKHNVLEILWKKTISICDTYINTEWINNLGIDKKVLIEDIKEHSIFTFYLSIINKNSTPLTVKDSVNKYLLDYEQKKDYVYNKKLFPDHLLSWLESIDGGDCDINYIYNQLNSDFYLSFYKDFIDENQEFILTNDERTDIINKNSINEIIFNMLVPLDGEIFYEVIKSWNDCPYNFENKYGMLLSKLFKFHDKLGDIIKKEDNSLNMTIKAYTIERLFNISFLCNLTEYLTATKDINGEKTLSHDESNLSGPLLVLHELLSIPMVFSRNKYIDSVFKSYKNHASFDYNFKLRGNLFYLNSFLIPLLIKVYYYLIYSYFTYLSVKISPAHENNYIENSLKSYIEEKLKSCYNHDKLSITNKERLLKSTSEQFQINITQMFYTYEYDRYNLNKDEDIFNIMSTFNENIAEYIINPKYDFQSYFHNFPFNGIYGAYKSMENKKAKKNNK